MAIVGVEEKTWKQYADLAQNYKAIGQTEIWLMRDQEAPWHLVTSMEDGASYRLSIPVSISLSAQDPVSGLTFNWSLDIEKREANGRGSYMFDVERLRSVREQLPQNMRARFHDLLAVGAMAARKQADEYQKFADEQRSMATELERI